jgi:hypothetical protein
MAGFLSALSQEGLQFVKFGLNSQKFVYVKIFIQKWPKHFIFLSILQLLDVSENVNENFHCSPAWDYADMQACKHGFPGFKNSSSCTVH